MTKNLDPSFSRADWNVAPEEALQTHLLERRHSEPREPRPPSFEPAWLPPSGRPEPYEIEWLE